jgi:hypothetical protein
MRTFRDSDDTIWTVFEVRRQLTGRLEPFLPGGYNDGWLCFETKDSKRRLTKYPPRWREASDDELTRLLHEALPAPRGASRIIDDFGDNSAAPDARAD